MQNNRPQKQRKFQRATPEQLKYFTEYSNKRSELLEYPSRVKDLWQELAMELNSMRGPTRTPSKWRESLIHWKHQIRSRARKQQQRALEKLATCKLDEHTLKDFGLTAVKGEPQCIQHNFESPSTTNSSLASFNSLTESANKNWELLYEHQQIIVNNLQNINTTLSELTDYIKSKEYLHLKI